MPIIDGEKYACQSCIKGHRVSGCQHVDRELTHINPKGRPVKQCEHCRGARKAKSHHARCDCGNKKDKDAAKDKPKAEGHDGGCCCYNGSKCTCGLKKEPLTLKLDTNFPKTIPPQQQQSRPKHRLTSANSESQLTVFANGHHKPCHRLNNSAHTSGVPYKIPRSHTLHGSISSSHHHSHSSLGQLPAFPTQRSIDDLASNESSSFPHYSGSVDSLPLNTLPESDNMFYSHPPSNSGAGSDRSSPVDVQSADAFGFPQWPWTANHVSASSQYGLEALSTSPTADYASNFDSDFAIPSAGLNPLWSAGDLPLNPGKLTKTMTPPMSLSGDSTRPSVPGLTSGSSGAQSEAGDPVCLADADVLNPQSAIAETFLYDDMLSFRRTERAPHRMTSIGKWPDYRQPPTSVPASESPRAMDMDHMKRAQQGPFHASSPSVEHEKPLSSMGMDAKSIMYTANQGDFSPATYPHLGNAPRSLTMPSSPAETNYNDLTSWQSSLGLTGTGYDLTGDEFNFNNTVDLPSYHF